MANEFLDLKEEENEFLNLKEEEENEFLNLQADAPNEFLNLTEGGGNEFLDLQETEDTTFLGEAGRAIKSGLYRAAEAGTEFAMTPMKLMLQTLTGDESLDPFKDVLQEPLQKIEPARPRTSPGRIAEALVQFGGGVLMAGGAAGVGQGVVRGATAGVMAEQVAFDPHEERLSNIIESVPELNNPVTQFLAADEDDNEAEARLKMAVEGMGLGAFADSLFRGLRNVRLSRKAKAAMESRELPPDVAPAVAKEKESLIELSTNIEQAKKAGKIPNPRPSPVEPNLNVKHLDTTDAIDSELKRIEAQHDNFAPERRGVVSHEETRRLANTLGLQEEELLESKGGGGYLAHEALAMRQSLVGSANEVVELAKKAKSGNAEDLFAFQQAYTRHVAIQEKVAGVTAEAGRLLNQFNMMARAPGSERAKLLRQVVEASGGKKNLDDLVAHIAEVESPEALAAFTRRGKKSKLTELWINGLLSGPQTHAVNMLSNSAVALWSIPEHLLAAGLGKLRKGGDKTFVREVLARAYGMGEGAIDGVRLAGKVLMDPNAELPWTKLEWQPSIGGVTGKVVNTPTRALQMEDAFFQAMGYRMQLRQDAMHSALEQGLKGKALAKHVASYLAHPTEKAMERARANARNQTFTDPVGPLAAGISKFANEHPAARFVVPFVRTPTNILKYTMERNSPLATHTARYKAAIAEGGRAADVARARMMLGSGLTTGLILYGADGRITGGGPTDPELYKTWRNQNQPYSIKIGEESYSYQRIEPFGMMLGLAADIATAHKYIGTGTFTEEEEAELEQAVALYSLAVYRNLGSKTWLRGISDLLNAMADPERYGESYVRNFMGTAVPAGVAQATRVLDPEIKDTQNIMDRLMSRIPGMSERVPAQVDLFGEKRMSEGGLGPDWMSPIWTQSERANPIAQEMLRLQMDNLALPSRKIQGVGLTPAQYENFAAEAGKTATQVARALIKSRGWKNIPDPQKKQLLKKTYEDVRKIVRLKKVIEFGMVKDIAEKKLQEYK